MQPRTFYSVGLADAKILTENKTYDKSRKQAAEGRARADARSDTQKSVPCTYAGLEKHHGRGVTSCPAKIPNGCKTKRKEDAENRWSSKGKRIYTTFKGIPQKRK